MASKVVTITVSRRPYMWRYASENVLRQELRPSLSLLAIHGDWTGWDAFTKPIHDAGIPVLVAFVDARVSAGELTNLATTQAAEYERDALVCKFDDDDYYGANYLREMMNAWGTHRDAWVLGKSAYRVRYVGGAKDGKTEEDAGRIIDAEGHATALAGSTFCIPSEKWRLFDQFRYPDMGLGCDGALIQKASWVMQHIGVQYPQPFYHVESAEFFLQRHLNAWHGHHWQRPQDYE